MGERKSFSDDVRGSRDPITLQHVLSSNVSANSATVSVRDVTNRNRIP